MGQKQLQRWHPVKMLEVGKITFKEAVERIGVSCKAGQTNSNSASTQGIERNPPWKQGVPSVEPNGEKLIKK